MRRASRRTKKKISALDKYLIFCIVFFVLYSITELILSCTCNIAHDTLTDAVKWFCGGEVFLCAMIKRLKLKQGENTAENNEGGMYYDD